MCSIVFVYAQRRAGRAEGFGETVWGEVDDGSRGGGTETFCNRGTRVEELEESGESGKEESVGTVGEVDEKDATVEGVLDPSGS